MFRIEVLPSDGLTAYRHLVKIAFTCSSRVFTFTKSPFGSLHGDLIKVQFRILFLLLGLAVLPRAEALDFDLPHGVTLQLGFNVKVVPSPQDASRQLGLIVTPERVLTDKRQSLSVRGTITNISAVPYSGLDLRFAVTSYTAIGTSFGHATVTPDYLPPGGTAQFDAFIFLDYEKPDRAAYTLTAHATSVVHPESPPAAIYQEPSDPPLSPVHDAPVVYY